MCRSYREGQAAFISRHLQELKQAVILSPPRQKQLLAVVKINRRRFELRKVPNIYFIDAIVRQLQI